MNTHALMKTRNQRGAILVLFAVTIPFLIACSSLAVDMAYIYAEKGHMQNAVDAATLAGANNLRLDGSNDTTVKEIVKKYATYNNESPDTVKDDNSIKIIHNTKENFSTIQVIMTRDVPLHFMQYFLKPLGITTMKVAVTATGKTVPDQQKKDYDLINNPLFKYAVIANKITYTKTLFNGSTKLKGPDFSDYNERYKNFYHKDPTSYSYYRDYYMTYGKYPTYTTWWGTYTYTENDYNAEQEGKYWYMYYYDLRYASSTKTSATIVGKYNTNGNNDYIGNEDGNSRYIGKTNLDTRLSSTNSNVADLISLLNNLLPDQYDNSFLQSSPTISNLAPYMKDGVYFNTSTKDTNVNFKYNNPIDNPENPYYQLNKEHEGGSAIIDGIKYSIIISNGNINTMNIDNQNSTDNTNTYNEPVLLISLNGNVTIDEDTPHHHFNGIVYAPKGTVTVKTPYDGSIVAKDVIYAPYEWPGKLSPVRGDGSYFGITDRYKEYKAVYYGGDYTKGSVSLIK